MRITVWSEWMKYQGGLVTVAQCTDALEAHILAGRLNAEGIQAFVAHEHHVWANWFLSQALEGVKVQVSARDADAAVKLLADLEQGAFAVEEPERCPACGSVEIAKPSGSQRLALLALWFVALPLPFSKRASRCSHCGRKLDSEA